MKRIAVRHTARKILMAMCLAASLVFIATPPAESQQNLEVKRVNRKTQEVVLRNNYTGEEWTARRGDEVDGMRILEVGSNHIKLSWVVKENIIGVTQIPVNSRPRVHRLKPLQE
jgi:hypothetical protein